MANINRLLMGRPSRNRKLLVILEIYETTKERSIGEHLYLSESRFNEDLVYTFKLGES